LKPSTPTDPFDPNNWPQPNDHEFRIYGDNNAQTYCVVDEIDYHWAIRWRWRFSGYGYMQRAVAVGSMKDGSRTAKSVYLHVEIMKRVREPTTPAHVIVDHRDTDKNNCRRSNLRWATYSMNNKNQYGLSPHDLVE
jgi:hypothetical protein